MISATPGTRAAITPSAPPEMETTTTAISTHDGGGLRMSRLIWIGVGIVVGVLIAKQIPQARRYMRLERM
ncbi:MAG TPA: hypothetical protein VIP11_17390 [Gemmatimonadaceae bacterium]